MGLIPSFRHTLPRVIYLSSDAASASSPAQTAFDRSQQNPKKLVRRPPTAFCWQRWARQ